MKINTICTLIMCAYVCVSCVNMSPLDLGDEAWIGKWNSQLHFIEIGENGYGEWSVIFGEGESAGLFKTDPVLIGKVDIEDETLIIKEQAVLNIFGIPVPVGPKSKRFSIDQIPT